MLRRVFIKLIVSIPFLGNFTSYGKKPRKIYTWFKNHIPYKTSGRGPKIDFPLAKSVNRENSMQKELQVAFYGSRTKTARLAHIEKGIKDLGLK